MGRQLLSPHLTTASSLPPAHPQDFPGKPEARSPQGKVLAEQAGSQDDQVYAGNGAAFSEKAS